MRANQVPLSWELAAHVDTAFDAARHWMQRGLYARPTDKEMWDNATYFPRVLLARASDNYTQLGYALWREYQAAPDDDARRRLAGSSVQLIKIDKPMELAQAAIEGLRDSQPDDPQARAALGEAKQHLVEASEWTRAILVLLEVGQDRYRWPGGRVRSLDQEPDRSDDLDHGAL